MSSRVIIMCQGPNAIVVNGSTTITPGQSRGFDVHDNVQLTIDDAVAPASEPAWASEMATKLDGIDSVLGGVDSQVGTMDGKLDSIDSVLGGVDSLLGTMDGKLDTIVAQTAP